MSLHTFGRSGHRTARLLVMWGALLLSVVPFVYMAQLNARMQDSGGPGIIELELTRTSERATQHLRDLGLDGIEDARRSLYADFPYLLLYGTFYVLAVGFARERLGRRWEKGDSPLFLTLAVLSPLFDLAENVSLLQMLDGNTATWPALAFVFAIAKFASAAVVLLYALAGLGLGRKPSPVPTRGQ